MDITGIGAEDGAADVPAHPKLVSTGTGKINSSEEEMRNVGCIIDNELSVPVRSLNSRIKCETISESQLNAMKERENCKKITEDDPRTHTHYTMFLEKEGKSHKIWVCGICIKQFRHRYTLARHLSTHTTERKYHCEACGQGFRQKLLLTQHLAIHSDARPYVCLICQKTYNRLSTLISHRKIHSSVKAHKCEICGKGFHQKGNLRNHKFTHTNERPYKCESCGKGFNQMSNLRYHKLSCKRELKSHKEYKHGLEIRGQIEQDSHNKRSQENKKIIPNEFSHHSGDQDSSSVGGVIDPITAITTKDGEEENKSEADALLENALSMMQDEPVGFLSSYLQDSATRLMEFVSNEDDVQFEWYISGQDL